MYTHSFSTPASPYALYIFLLGIEAIHEFHALLVHGEDDATAQHEPRQPRQRAAPEGQHALVLEDQGRAPRAVPVDLPRLDALHARLDGVERLGDGDGDGPGDAADAKGGDGAELLPRRRVRLGQLLQRRVAAEAHGAVGALAGRRGHEALEEAAQAPLARDDGHGVQEAAEPRVRGLAVVDERRLDGLGGRDGEQGLGDAGAEAREHVAGARDVAVGVGQQPLVLLEGHEADRRLGRVADDERRAPGVPLPAERRPRRPLARREVAVQLRARLGELGRVGDGDLDRARRRAREDGAQRAGLLGLRS